MAKFEVIEDKNARSDVDYKEDKIQKNAAGFAQSVRTFIGLLNYRLAEGTLKAGHIDGGDMTKASTTLQDMGVSTHPLEQVILSDFKGTKESAFRLTLDDRSQIVIPVTPVNLNQFTKALHKASEAVAGIKEKIGPLNPGVASDVNAQLTGMLKKDLAQFVVQQ
jgi:hypothetical protein